MEFDNRAGFNGLLGISNRAVSTRWTHLFSDNLFSVFNFSWSRYRNSFETENAGFETMVENVIQDFTLKGNLEWFTSPEWTMKGGFEVNRYVLQYLQNFSGDADSTAPSGSTDGGIVNLDETDHTASMFVQSNYQFSNLLSLQSGLRVNYYDLRNIVKLDPRLALRYQWNESIAVKAAWGDRKSVV